MSAIPRAATRALRSPAGHTEPIGGRNLAVESLRGIAALAVVGYHLAAVTEWPASFPPRLLLSNGDAGVTLFFVLSGFLLWRPFAKAAIEAGPMPGLRQFFTNRALRIVPAYWVALAVTIVALGATARGGAWRYLIFAQNYSRESFFGVISPAWSLAVEAVFYLVLPVAGFAAVRLARSAPSPIRAVYGVVGAWFAAGLAYKLYALGVQDVDPTDPLFLFNFPAKAHLFAGGMLLATWHARDRMRSPLGSSGRSALIGSAIVVAAVGIRYRSAATAAFFDTLTAAGFTLIVAAVAYGQPRLSRLSRSLHWRPLIAAGVVSYSIYLWHHPLIERLHEAGVLRSEFAWLPLNIVVVLAITIAVAAASYLLIERPFLKLRRRWS
ncbi:MAG TPA: acyltransferase [Actinomycetota bacterium]|nr:acyltransferase [Actinomycetota bacterium]